MGWLARRPPALRWFLIALAGLALLILVATILISVWLSTSSGQRFVKNKLEETLAPMFTEGSVTVGGTSLGLLGGTAGVTDLKIFDAKKVQVAHVKNLDVGISYGSLLSGPNTISKLNIELGETDLAKLAEIFKSDDEPTPDIALSHIHVEGGPVRYEDVAATLAVDTSVKIIDEQISAKVWVLNAQISIEKVEPTVLLTANEVVFQKDILELNELHVSSLATGTSFLSANGSRYNTVTGDLDVGLDISLQKEAFPVLYGAVAKPDWIPEDPNHVEGRITAKGKLLGLIEGTAQLIAGAGSMTSTFNVAPLAKKATMEIQLVDFQPNPIMAVAPKGKISAVLVGTANWKNDKFSASLGAAIRGVVQGLKIDALQVGATLEDQNVAASAFLSSSKGGGSLLAKTRGFDENLEVDYLNIQAGELNFKDFKRSNLPITGRVDALSVSASGNLEDLDLDLSVKTTALRYQEFSTDKATIRGSARVDVLGVLDGTHLPERGDIFAEVTNLKQSGTVLGSGTLEGVVTEAGRKLTYSSNVRTGESLHPLTGINITGSLDRNQKGLAINLDKVIAKTSDVEWNAKGAILRKNNGALSFRNLSVSSPLAAISINGNMPQGREPPNFSMDIEKIDFERLRELAPQIPEHVRGTLQGEVKLTSQGNKQSASSSLRIRDLSVAPDAELLDVDFEAVVKDRRADLDLNVAVKSGGKVSVKMGSRAPLVPTNVEYWQRTGLANVQEAQITAIDFPIAQIVALAYKKMPTTQGVLNGSISVGDKGEEIDLKLDVRQAGWAEIRGVRSQLEARWDRDQLAATASLSLQNSHVLDATVKQAASLRDAIRNSKPFQTTPILARVTADKFDLQTLYNAKLISEVVSGTTSIDVLLSGTIADGFRYDLKEALVKDVKVRGASVESLRVSGTGNMEGGEISLDGSQRDGGLVRGKLLFALDPEFFIQKGSLFAKNFNLGVLRALATDNSHPLHDIAGRLEADFEVTGNTEDPKLKGRVQVSDGTIFLSDGIWHLTEIDLSVYLENKVLLLEKLKARAGDGEIFAAGRAKLGKLLPEELLIELKTEEFPIARADMRFEIDMLATLSGKLSKDGLDGRFQINRSRIDIIRGGDELQEIGDLEDIVFIDEQARREREESDAPARFKPIRLAIASKRPIDVESRNEAKLKLNVDLKLLLEDLQPSSLVGSVNVLNGTVNIFDQAYTVNLGRITFDGPLDDPNLEIGLSKNFPSSTVQVALDGPVSRLRIDLSDDQGNDELAVLAIMNGQDPDDEDSKVEGSEFVNAVGNVLGGSVRSYLPASILDVLRFSPQGVVVGKWVLPSVLALYQFRSLDNQSRGNRHEGTIEWHIIRYLLLESSYGDRDIGNADLLFHYRF